MEELLMRALRLGLVNTVPSWALLGSLSLLQSPGTPSSQESSSLPKGTKTEIVLGLELVVVAHDKTLNTYSSGGQHVRFPLEAGDRISVEQSISMTERCDEARLEMPTTFTRSINHARRVTSESMPGKEHSEIVSDNRLVGSVLTFCTCPNEGSYLVAVHRSDHYFPEKELMQLPLDLQCRWLLPSDSRLTEEGKWTADAVGISSVFFPMGRQGWVDRDYVLDNPLVWLDGTIHGEFHLRAMPEISHSDSENDSVEVHATLQIESEQRNDEVMVPLGLGGEAEGSLTTITVCTLELDGALSWNADPKCFGSLALSGPVKVVRSTTGRNLQGAVVSVQDEDWRGSVKLEVECHMTVKK